MVHMPLRCTRWKANSITRKMTLPNSQGPDKQLQEHSRLIYSMLTWIPCLQLETVQGSGKSYKGIHSFTHTCPRGSLPISWYCVEFCLTSPDIPGRPLQWSVWGRTSFWMLRLWQHQLQCSSGHLHDLGTQRRGLEQLWTGLQRLPPSTPNGSRSEWTLTLHWLASLSAHKRESTQIRLEGNYSCRQDKAPCVS